MTTMELTKNGVTSVDSGSADVDSDMDLLEDDEGHESRDLDGDSLRCGYFCWSPACLQCCNRPCCLLACISWFTFVQGEYLYDVTPVYSTDSAPVITDVQAVH